MRLARQFLTENLLLVCLGGALAIPFALGALSLMGTVLPEAVPRCNDVGLNLRAATYLALLTVSAGVFFGLVPLLAGPHHALATAMSEASGRMAGTAPRWERLRKLLVTASMVPLIAGSVTASPSSGWPSCSSLPPAFLCEASAI